MGGRHEAEAVSIQSGCDVQDNKAFSWIGVIATLPAQCVISAAKGQKFFAQSHVSFAWTFHLILWARRQGLYKAVALISFSWSTVKKYIHIPYACAGPVFPLGDD